MQVEQPQAQLCPTCGHMEQVHFVPSVCALPELHAAYEVRGLEKQGDTNKRRRTTIDKGRLLTGEEWCDIIKDK